jgi:hypothetical protein
VARYAELERAEGFSGDRAHPDWLDFDREGYAIAFAVKAELPDWRVFYVEESSLALPRRAKSPIEIPDRLE